MDKQTVTINDDGEHIIEKKIKITGDMDINDTDTLLNLHGYNPEKWDLLNAKNSIWDVQRKHGILDTFYASKITVKPKESIITTDTIKEFFDNLNRTHTIPKRKSIKKKNNINKRLLEIPITDLHIGKLCIDECSGSTYNMTLAESQVNGLINDIIERYKNEKVDKILFVFGNDYFHYDNIQKTTSNGTPQDSDTLIQPMFIKGVELLIKSIDLLAQKCPVDVLYIPGNHDKTIGFFALQTLNAWYRNDPWVNINIDFKTRQYYRYGKSLIGFSHGDKDCKRLETLMPVEEPKHWGETTFREFHLGHLHSESTKEVNGVIIRRLSSLAGTDNWHNESGYVGAVKKSMSFLWDYDKGLLETKYHVL